MKLATKLSGLAATLMIAGTVVSAGQAFAFTDGQIEGGDIYRIKDLTTNSDFTSNQTANKCDTLEYRARLYNPGGATLTGVSVEAHISNSVVTKNTSTLDATATNADPSHTYAFATVNLTSAQSLSYVPGTTQLLDQNDNPIKNLPDGITISGTGVNLGDLGPSVIEFVQFQEKVSCPTPPPAPVFSCDALSISAGDNRTVKITAFNTTATNGATFKDADINWGDSSTDTAVNPVVGKTHQYAADGTYTIAATAHFTVNGQDKTATGPQCEQQVAFKAGVPPVVTPPPATTVTPPTALVNTGAGNVAGLFAAVTVASAVAYRRLLSRRLSRQ